MRIFPILSLALVTLAACPLPLGAAAAGADAQRRVVIIAMDGLRPDSVTEADMPNLWKLSREGTFFANHHPVWVSTTEVNGTALATGMSPAHSGVTGNIEFRPEVDPDSYVAMEGEYVTWKGDEETGGKWVLAQTLPEIVRAGGGKTAVAGTKGVALLWDRKRDNRTVDSPTLFVGESIPTALRDQIVARQGPLPPGANSYYFANRLQDAWTTQALLSRMWAAGVPQLTMLWLSEPDLAQHYTGPGSKVAREALKSSDDCLGRVLAALTAARVREQTDVFVVSDHGFSTVAQAVDVVGDLRAKGFNAGSTFLDPPETGTIVVLPLGGSVSYYVVGKDAALIERLVRHLQTTGYAGPIFTRAGIEGTFKLADVGMDAATAADVVLSLRWSDSSIQRAGAMPGLVLSTGYDTGQGMHGTLSRFDMHNTLIAAGPSIKAGLRSTTPSGNSDLAPTVLRILGLTPPAPMDGRVLEEALNGSTGPAPAVETETLTAARQLEVTKRWQQYLKVSKVNGRRYYDEGNAGPPPP